MYGKLFAQMFDGSLHGHWQAIVTMQQLVILADEQGCIDITPAALSARTSIPLEIITKGLEFLAQPDPNSRGDEQEGRRIVPLAEHRNWGWQLVNHRKYRDIRSADDLRAAARDRKRRQRARARDVTHTDTDTDTEKQKSAQSARGADAPPPSGGKPPNPDSRLGVLAATRDPQFLELASDVGLDLESFRKFLDYRWRTRKPLRVHSIEAAAKMLARYGPDQAAVVEQTIGNGWQGLRELQQRRDQIRGNTPPVVFLDRQR